MKNLDPLSSDCITRIYVTPDSNVSLIEAALNAKTGTVVLSNEQGIHLTFTPSDRLNWDHRFSQPSKVALPDQ